MSTPYPPEHPPSWVVPIAAGALATFGLQSLTLLLPVLWCATCCTCGLSGVPVGFLPAILAVRQDPNMSPVQGFAVSFIATGIGALAVAFVVMGVQGWEVPPDALEQIREGLTELNRDAPAGEQLSPEEIEGFVDTFGQLAQFLPVIASGLVIVMGGLSGMVTVSFMRRRALRPPPA